MNLFLGIAIFVGSDVANVLYNLLMTLSDSFCIFFAFIFYKPFYAQNRFIAIGRN